MGHATFRGPRPHSSPGDKTQTPFAAAALVCDLVESQTLARSGPEKAGRSVGPSASVPWQIPVGILSGRGIVSS